MSALAASAMNVAPVPALTRGDVRRSYDWIVEQLPHRPPYVLLDRVVALEPGEHVTCIKNVSGGEPILAVHFPGYAILPGAMLLEAMAQATALMLTAAAVDTPDAPAKTPVLAAATVRWLAPVRPGDQVLITARSEKRIAGAAVVHCTATVGSRLMARARLTVATVALDG